MHIFRVKTTYIIVDIIARNSNTTGIMCEYTPLAHCQIDILAHYPLFTYHNVTI
jgi:hydrogenase maturation factor HypF (carbamoyltransferase family)